MEEKVTTPGEFAEIVKRRKLSFFVAAGIVLLAAVIVAVALPSIYKSTSTILIEEQDVPRDFVMATVTTYADQQLQTINQRVMSYSRLLEIINRFNLYQELKDKWTTEEIVDEMRKDISLETISADVVNRQTGKPAAATIAFTLSYEGKTPQTVQQVANVLASLYLQENLQVRERKATETSRFLGDEMTSVRTTLGDLEKKIATFKEQHMNELPELLQLNVQSVERLERDTQTLNDQLRTLKEREGYLQAQLASVPRGTTDKQRLDMLRVQLVELKARFSDDYPDVVKTRAEIAELEKRLGISSSEGGGTPSASAAAASSGEQADNPAYVTLASQLSSTQADIESVKRQVNALSGRIADYRRRIEATPGVEEEYRALVVERDNTKAKYDDLMRKSMEAKVSQVLEKEQKGERFTLIDAARLPETPDKPNRLAIMLIGLVLSLGAGVGTASLKEFTDQSVRKEEDLALATSFPVLASIPDIVTEKEEAQQKKKRLAIVVGVIAVLVAGILIFHFFIMDLSVFWAIVSRRLGF